MDQVLIQTIGTAILRAVLENQYSLSVYIYILWQIDRRSSGTTRL